MESNMTFSQTDLNIIKDYAKKYIWWKTPDEAISMPYRVIVQVMNIGDYSDVQTLSSRLGDATLRDVLAHAEAGQFSPKSWAYWNYRLGTIDLDVLPPLPQREII